MKVGESGERVGREWGESGERGELEKNRGKGKTDRKAAVIASAEQQAN